MPMVSEQPREWSFVDPSQLFDLIVVSVCHRPPSSPGILQMEKTVLGGIEVNPHKLLNEGLRKELVSHISELLSNLLQFDFSADSETIASMWKHLNSAMRSLASLSGRLQAFQCALECVDDYLCMHGLQIWHQEMGRIISYNVEQEVRRRFGPPGRLFRRGHRTLTSIPQNRFACRSISISSRRSSTRTPNSNRTLSQYPASPGRRMSRLASISWEGWCRC